MMRIAAIALFAAAACGVPTTQKSNTLPDQAATTESEWRAASDLATTLAKAAGAERLAPALRIHDHGAVSRRHVTLAAAGCYHAGIAWVSDVAIDASVSFDPGTNVQLAGQDRRIAAPGGALDFCTDHAGGATLTFRAMTPVVPDRFEYAVVYGSGKAPRAAAKATRTAHR